MIYGGGRGPSVKPHTADAAMTVATMSDRMYMPYWKAVVPG